MTTFKDGDKVRRIAGWNPSVPTEEFGVVKEGLWGTITHDNVPVRWADGHLRGVFPRNIELVQEDTVTSPEPKFNVGDLIVVEKHQWNIDYDRVDGPVTGKVVGTIRGQVPSYLVEHTDKYGKVIRIYTARNEADNLRRAPKFNVGDRVVYTGNDTANAKGLIGTVKKIEDAEDTEYAWLLLTDLDRSQAPDVLPWFNQGYAHNFSLYTEPVVEEAEDTAPTFQGDIFELRERLLALAVKVGDFGSTGETVVEEARTFENYITGGTK